MATSTLSWSVYSSEVYVAITIFCYDICIMKRLTASIIGMTYLFLNDFFRDPGPVFAEFFSMHTILLSKDPWISLHRPFWTSEIDANGQALL